MRHAIEVEQVAKCAQLGYDVEAFLLVKPNDPGPIIKVRVVIETRGMYELATSAATNKGGRARRGAMTAYAPKGKRR